MTPSFLHTLRSNLRRRLVPESQVRPLGISSGVSIA